MMTGPATRSKVEGLIGAGRYERGGKRVICSLLRWRGVAAQSPPRAHCSRSRAIGARMDAATIMLLMNQRPQEGWPSGLRRTLGKRVCVKAYRGFESHSLRQEGVHHYPSVSRNATNSANP